MKVRQIVLVLAAVAPLAVLAAACESKHAPTAVRNTMDAQAVKSSPEIASQSAKAQKTLDGWSGDAAVDLALAVEEAEREIILAFAAIGDESDLRYRRSVDAFRSATEIIAAAARPLEKDDAAAVTDLLIFSRASALASRTGEPTAVSPANALKTLRKHQTATTHYEY